MRVFLFFLTSRGGYRLKCIHCNILRCYRCGCRRCWSRTRVYLNGCGYVGFADRRRIAFSATGVRDDTTRRASGYEILFLIFKAVISFSSSQVGQERENDE
ncbi:hypothetical protein TNCV_3633441 [Trichonephila clavipes]|nr:hypothetical protein TNCV_3633441 [Trichonephila clavipes]